LISDYIRRCALCWFFQSINRLRQIHLVLEALYRTPAAFGVCCISCHGDAWLLGLREAVGQWRYEMFGNG